MPKGINIKKENHKLKVYSHLYLFSLKMMLLGGSGIVISLFFYFSPNYLVASDMFLISGGVVGIVGSLLYFKCTGLVDDKLALIAKHDEKGNPVEH